LEFEFINTLGTYELIIQIRNK